MDEMEKEILIKLLEREDLAEKKAKIFSRLLMDVEKAKLMEALAKRHENARKRLEILLYGKPLKNKNA